MVAPKIAWNSSAFHHLGTGVIAELWCVLPAEGAGLCNFNFTV